VAVHRTCRQVLDSADTTVAAAILDRRRGEVVPEVPRPSGECGIDPTFTGCSGVCETATTSRSWSYDAVARTQVRGGKGVPTSTETDPRLPLGVPGAEEGLHAAFGRRCVQQRLNGEAAQSAHVIRMKSAVYSTGDDALTMNRTVSPGRTASGSQ
jgi:hypothetical protein